MFSLFPGPAPGSVKCNQDKAILSSSCERLDFLCLNVLIMPFACFLFMRPLENVTDSVNEAFYF